MPYSEAEKAKLLKRLNRIRGQVDALCRALEKDVCISKYLQQAAACRDAMDGFIAAVIEHHIRTQIMGADAEAFVRDAADDLMEIIHAYLT